MTFLASVDPISTFDNNSARIPGKILAPRKLGNTQVSQGVTQTSRKLVRDLIRESSPSCLISYLRRRTRWFGDSASGRDDPRFPRRLPRLVHSATVFRRPPSSQLRVHPRDPDPARGAMIAPRAVHALRSLNAGYAIAAARLSTARDRQAVTLFYVTLRISRNHNRASSALFMCIIFTRLYTCLILHKKLMLTGVNYARTTNL